ncbi:MAG: fibronectin type III domain-containing protein [Deltaproteobacteria bacterium]|nr:fibronectin type III domain-containing protein [Deltaproteobacteria bacterium]
MMPKFARMNLPVRLRELPVIFLVPFLLWGCGSKTFPSPFKGSPPPQVKDLEAHVRSRTVEISWSFPEELRNSAKGKDPGYLFVVLKTEPRWENRNCLDCPTPSEEEVQFINPTMPEPARLEGDRLVWSDRSVAPQRVYRYRVAIQDGKKRTLSVSNPALVKVVPPPGPLKNLMAFTQTRGILLKWKPPNKDDQGNAFQGDLFFLIERKAQDKPWQRVSSVHLRGDSFLDSGVASGQTYNYRVTPYLIFEETTILGEPSTFQQAKAPQALPPPPPGKVWVIPSKGALEVHWIESEGRAGGYHVYRKEGKDIIRLTASPIQRPPYVDKAIKRDVVYHYAVSAVDTQAGQQEGLLSTWAEIRSLMTE